MNLKKINDEVFVAQDPIVKIGSEEIAFLKSQSSSNQRGRARICAHKTNEDMLHEMIIAISASSYIHPHKHLGKSESFHVIEGVVDVAILSEVGEVVDVIELREQGTGRTLFYRLAQSMFHTLIIKSDYLVLHEVTNGPFIKENTILADFAPPENRSVEVQKYMHEIASQTEKFKATIN